MQIGVRSRGERLAWLVTTLVTVAALAGLFLFVMFRGRTPAAPEMRVAIDIPASADPMSFAVSPDGMAVVFAAEEQGLILRRLSSAAAEPIRGTAGARLPFWAPDGSSIGFFSGGKLRTLSLNSGARETVADANEPRGGAWNNDGTLLFAEAGGPVMRIKPGATSKPSPATHPAPPRAGHSFPRFLADGRHFVYFSQGEPDGGRGIYLASLDGLEGVRLAGSDSAGTVAGGSSLLFVRQGALVAQNIDVAGRRLIGSVVIIATDVAVDSTLDVAAVSAGRDTVMLRTPASLTGLGQPPCDCAVTSSLQVILNWPRPSLR